MPEAKYGSANVPECASHRTCCNSTRSPARAPTAPFSFFNVALGSKITVNPWGQTTDSRRPSTERSQTGSRGSVGLPLAGRTDPLVADDAVARLHQASLGLPRALNNLARDALIAAAADGKALVDDACARKAVAEAVSE